MEVLNASGYCDSVFASYTHSQNTPQKIEHTNPEHAAKTSVIFIILCTHKDLKLLIMKMPLTGGMAVSEMRSHKLLIGWLSKTLLFNKMFYNNRCWYKY